MEAPIHPRKVPLAIAHLGDHAAGHPLAERWVEGDGPDAVGDRRRCAWAVISEWDPEKARTNLLKHRIAFAEASSVFLDALALTFPDPHRLEGDEREITIGHSARGRTLFSASSEHPHASAAMIFKLSMPRVAPT